MDKPKNICLICDQYIKKQKVFFFVCKHNVICSKCVWNYFEEKNTCPLCKILINGLIIIDGKFVNVSKIAKSNEQLSDAEPSDEESIPSETECSGCNKIIFTEDEIYERCECYTNKSFICKECIEENDDLESYDICDSRCNPPAYISPTPYEPSENSYDLLAETN